MRFVWDVEPTANWVVGLIIAILVFGALFFMFLKIVKRKSALIFLAIATGITVVCYLFNLTFPLILSATLSGVGVAVILFANLGDLRLFIANPFKKTSAKAANFKVEKIFDRKAMYRTIETTVLALSKSKTGAIMTFEKNTSLKDIIGNGVPVHAPVSSELLMTIFYEGTRLHDGAVVIHGNEIVAASVFFTPTTKPFAGKYGSRHRAAIGISEVSDAITVVVSEETGRISFAVNGELETVEQTNFLRVFENYMDDIKEGEDEEE